MKTCFLKEVARLCFLAPNVLAHLCVACFDILARIRQRRAIGGRLVKRASTPVPLPYLRFIGTSSAGAKDQFRLKFFRTSLFLAVTFFICHSKAFAQQIIYLDQQLENLPPSEKEMETVTSRIKDLDSENPEIRRSAVLILGKYPRNPQASSAVIRMLKDTNSDVRRSALVSLIESNAIPPQAAQSIIEMLDDEDVHIRRIASSALPNFFFYLSGFDYDPVMQRTVRRELSPKAKNAILKSFSDTDSGVRKNMLSNLSYLNQYVDSRVLLPLFEDSDRDIRLLAIEKALGLIPPDKAPQIIEKLSHDSDSLVRLKLAESLRFNFRNPKITQTLKNMLSDESKPVRDEALCALLIAGECKDLNLIEKTLLDPETDQKTAKMILPYIRQTGTEDRILSTLKKIYENGSEHLKASAL
ncbi:MAG: HEAT repeat domain-containing protein, partial [Candidatus Nanoarchaeia archaeon]